MALIGELKATLKIELPGVQQAVDRTKKYMDDLKKSLESARAAIAALEGESGKLDASLDNVGEGLDPAPAKAAVEAIGTAMEEANKDAAQLAGTAKAAAKTIGTALDETTKDADQLTEALKKPGQTNMSGLKATLTGVQSWLQKVKVAYSQTRDEQGRFQKGASGLGDTLKRLGQNALSVAAGMGIFNGLMATFRGLIETGIGWNQMMEVSAAKWETLLGSAQAAQEQLAWMADFAAATPFEYAELDNASSRMKAFGFTIEQTRALLGTLGDAAAATGTGSEGIDRITTALGQMNAKTKVQTQEMMQLTEMGIPAWQMLADAMGITTPELMKLVEQGLVPAGKAIPVLVEGMNKAFGGSMAKQAQTFTGRISTLKDNVKMLLGDAFKPAFGWLSGTALPAVIGLVDKLSAGFKEGGFMGAVREAFGPKTAVLIENIIGGVRVLWEGFMAVADIAAPAVKAALGGLVAVIGATFGWIKENGELVKVIIVGIAGAFAAYAARQVYFTTVAKLATAAQWALNAAMNANPIGIIITLIGALIAVGIYLVKNWDSVKRSALNVWGSIKATIFNAIASIMELYAKFIGLFSEEKAEAARKAAEAMRQQAQAERDMIDGRNDAVERSAAYAEYQEQRKQDAATHAAGEVTKTWEAAGSASNQVWENMAESAGESLGKQQEYLDEFGTAFDRTQEDAMTTFDRRQEAELDALEKQQEAQLTALEKFQEAERQALQQSQEDRLREFKNALEDETTAKKRALEDQLTAQEAIWEQEATAFKRSQEDQLDAFKDRLNEEMQGLKERQEAELEATNAEYRARKRAIQDQIDAIRDQEKAAQNASKIAGLEENVQKAKDDVTRAEMTGDSVAIYRAQEKLNDALAKLAEEQAKQARDAKIDGLEDQLAAVEEEARQQIDALEKNQKAEADALKQSQEERLKAYERDLQDDAAHFAQLQEARKEAFKRIQEDEMEAFKRIQEVRMEQYKREQEAEQQRLEERQEQLRESLKTIHEAEMTALKQRQDDLKTQYQREVQDFKAALADKLAAQRQYLADLAALQEEIAALAPASDAGGPAGTATATANIPKFAKGAVVDEPTLGIFGEAGTEAVTPLDWLLSTIRGVARDVALRVAALRDPAGRGGSAAGGGVAQGALSRPAGSETKYILQFGANAITIPAKDLAELKSVQDFFALLQQSARAITGEA